jgi:hypothetical protein
MADVVPSEPTPKVNAAAFAGKFGLIEYVPALVGAVVFKYAFPSLAVPVKIMEMAVKESIAARPVVEKARVATIVEPVNVSVWDKTVTVKVSAFATVTARLTWALEL